VWCLRAPPEKWHTKARETVTRSAAAQAALAAVSIRRNAGTYDSNSDYDNLCRTHANSLAVCVAGWQLFCAWRHHLKDPDGIIEAANGSIEAAAAAAAD
jgi:hypothetical protein